MGKPNLNEKFNVSNAQVVEFDSRFVIIDGDTGEILDDANGNGFKSVQAAYSKYAKPIHYKAPNTPVKKPSKGKPEAVYSSKLSKKNDNRYVIIDSETGNVLDDCQGWGYKSPQKAHAGYAYQTRDKSKDKDKAKRKRAIQQWLKSHKSFVNELEAYAIDCFKGSGAPDDELDAKYVRELLKALNIQTEFKPSEILRVWGNDGY